MEGLQEVNCPICKGNNYEVVYQDLPLERTTVKLVKCINCSSVYINPRLTHDKLMFQYSDAEYLDNYYVNLVKPKLRRSRMVCSLYGSLIQKKKKNGRILDFGCGAGLLSSNLITNGFEVTSFDIGETNKKYAKEFSNISVQDVLDPAKYQNYFDVVAMVEVIEHLENPVETLAFVKSLLKDDGIIFITTPNYNSLQRLIQGKNWKAIVPQGHLIYFTERTLRTALKKSGLTLLEFKAYEIFFPVSFEKTIVAFARKSMV